MKLGEGTISIWLSKYARDELTISKSLFVEEQLLLWHAELCEKHDIECRYKWDECRDCYFCHIFMPRLRLSSQNRVNPKEQEDFYMITHYIKSRHVKGNINFSDAITHLKLLLKAAGRSQQYIHEIINKAISHIICETNRKVEFELYKVEREREITEEDIMMMLSGVTPPVPHIIADKESLREYIRRKYKEINTNRGREDSMSEKIFRDVDAEVNRFYENRKRVYKNGIRNRRWSKMRKVLYGGLIVALCIFAICLVVPFLRKGFWTIIVCLGIVAIGLLILTGIYDVMSKHRELEDDSLRRYSSWRRIFVDQVKDELSQPEFSYLNTKETTCIHWMYAVVYAATNYGNRKYAGKYIEKRWDSLYDIIKKNECSFEGSEAKDVFI